MAMNLSENIRLLTLEAYDRRIWMVGAFVAVSIVTTLVGLAWPQNYTSYSTVYVEDQSVFEPLLEGAAVTSRLNDRALIAREVIYGRKLLMQVVAGGGWNIKGMSEPEKDGIVDHIRKRTLVTNVGENLVRIEYSDSDPKRAQAVAQKIAELFIKESLNAKAQESESAYAFIDQQVEEYQTKLRKLEEGLKDFRTSNADAEPGAQVDVAHRMTELKDRMLQLSQDLREAEIRKASLQSQLSGEADVSTIASRTEEYRRRIGELRTQLDNLRLNYHDTYPDVVHIKGQIHELEAAAEEEEKRRSAGGGTDTKRLDETAIANPVFQELRRALYESNTEIRTLRSRLKETQRLLKHEEGRNHRIQAASTQLADLTRDYEVNKELYHDLLKRREGARVSMNLDHTQGNVSMRVEEPAFLPHSSRGPAQVLFGVGGVVLGVLLPIGGLFALQQTDQRVRHPSEIVEDLGLPVLGVIPHLQNPREGSAEARSVFTLSLVVAGSVVGVVLLSAMRMTGS